MKKLCGKTKKEKDNGWLPSIARITLLIHLVGMDRTVKAILHGLEDMCPHGEQI